MAPTFSSVDVGLQLEELRRRNPRVAQAAFRGEGSYANDDKFIRVDKGSPDKANFVIFYAEIEDKKPKDPMIFVNTIEQVNREVQKLAKRGDVDVSSVRIFSLAAVVDVQIKMVTNDQKKKEKK